MNLSNYILKTSRIQFCEILRNVVNVDVFFKPTMYRFIFIEVLKRIDEKIMLISIS